MDIKLDQVKNQLKNVVISNSIARQIVVSVTISTLTAAAACKVIPNPNLPLRIVIASSGLIAGYMANKKIDEYISERYVYAKVVR